MKKLLFILLLLPFFAQSQIVQSYITQSQVAHVDSTSRNNIRKANFPRYKTQTLYSYTIGIKAFSFEEMPKILNQVNTEVFNKQYLTGLLLKLNDNQISYRLSGSFYEQGISFKNECEECEEAKGNVSDNSLRIGFEKNVIYAAIQPYFGADLGFRRNTFDGEVTSLTTGLKTYDVTTQKNGFSISPIFGIKYNIVDHLTIAAESSIDMLYSYEKQERTFNDAAHTRTFQDFKKWEFLLRPVGMLSLQYNFGETY